MRARLLAAALLAVLPLGACGTKEEPVSDQVDQPEVSADAAVTESPLAFEGAGWDGWTGTYADVRPVGHDAVDELVQRVANLNDSSWTAVEASAGAEIASTPGHVRISAGPVVLHLDPSRWPDADPTVALCVAGEECAGPDEADEGFDRAGLFNLVAPASQATLEVQRLRAEDVEEVLDEGILLQASVASPIGGLDCLVHAEEEAVAGVEGSEVDLERPHDVGFFVSLCVDERGLVVAGPSEGAVATYSAWQPGVDGDITALEVPAEEPAKAPEPGADIDQVFWGTWEPTYSDVRPASEAEVEALEERVAALGRSEWTLVDATYGTETAYTPDRVRLRIAGAFDAYADPSDATESWHFVLCDEEECVDSRKLAEGDAPHLTSSFTDAMIFSAIEMARTQAQATFTADEHLVLATVDSPVGPLDCLVTGARGDDVAVDALEGADLVVDPTQVADPEDGPVLFTQCVDSRGLVIVGGGLLSPVTLVQSFHAGVEDDLAYPHPVRR